MLKEDLIKFVLGNSLFDCMGIASADPFPMEDVKRLKKCRRTFHDKTLIVHDDEVFQPEDMLPGAR